MAVPGSGQLSLLKIFSEKNEGDYTANNADGENTFSLRGLSDDGNDDSSGGNINLNIHSPNLPDSNAGHAMSEFYAYDHDFEPIPCNLAMDVVFLIDYTGSMDDDMEDLKTHVATITNKVVERSGGDYRLAAVLIDQDDNQPSYWSGNNTVVANLSSSYKFIGGVDSNVYLAAIVPLAHSNKSDFDTKISYLNQNSNSATSMELGYGEGGPEPNDTAIDRVINHDFAGAFRSGVNKMIILMTDNAPDGDGDDIFDGAEEYNKMGTLSANAVANNITIMICGSISDSGTHPQSVHGIYQGYADNTGGSFNSNHDPSNIATFINTICNDIESLFPSVTTNAETNVTAGGFTMNGDVANDSLSVTAKGFVRATTNVNLRKGVSGVTDTGSLGSGTAAFSSTVTGLPHSTTFYYRAYATTSNGGGLTSYGDIEAVTTTSATAPGIVTNLASSISSNGMTFNGNMTSTGNATVTDKGFVYSNAVSTPTIGAFGVTKVTPHPSTFNTTGSYSRAVTGLASASTYYFRAYATNSIGTSYGAVQQQATQSSYVTRYVSGPHNKVLFACFQTQNTIIRFTGTFGNGTQVYDNNLNLMNSTNGGNKWYGAPLRTSSGSTSGGYFYVNSSGVVSNYDASGC
jgi:hypothetical protein|tara:strand:+ start:2614 stop:4503 length:1890 start_codon:yes stop_codon:yes gene_type:complete